MIEERGFSQQLFYRALGTRRCRAPHVRRRDCAHDNARCHGSHDALPARFDARPCSSQHRLYWHGLSVACSCPCNQSLSQDSTTCCYQAFQASQKRRKPPPCCLKCCDSTSLRVIPSEVSAANGVEESKCDTVPLASRSFDYAALRPLRSG